MKKNLDQVKEFHERHGFAVKESLLSPMKVHDIRQLKATGSSLIEIAKSMISSPELSVQRLSLMLEEMGEVVEAVLDNDVVSLSDGLADLIYVVCGTAVAYGIPLDEIFDEVHSSNMTKPVTGEPLLKGSASKSGTYRKADVEGVLRRLGRIR